MTKIPTLKFGFCPDWWYEGAKMQITNFSKEDGRLSIDNDKAHLKISRNGSPDCYQVKWTIKHGSDEIFGNIAMSKKTLSDAFGLIHGICDHCSRWLISQYGGEMAEQFKFIRWRNFLNIPCPGTGHDGDPNISIEINEEIRKAVTELLT